LPQLFASEHSTPLLRLRIAANNRPARTLLPGERVMFEKDEKQVAFVDLLALLFLIILVALVFSCAIEVQPTDNPYAEPWFSYPAQSVSD
jgi:hypothetical protein